MRELNNHVGEVGVFLWLLGVMAAFWGSSRVIGKLVTGAHPGYGLQIFGVQFGWSSVGGWLLQGGVCGLMVSLSR